MKSHVLDGQNSKSEKKVENTTKMEVAASVKSIDSVVFDSFKGLTSSDENERVKSGLELLQHLSKTQNTEKRDKEVRYVLKRLVRGVGASTTMSRAGFFTTLVGFLETIGPDEMGVCEVLILAKKQLQIVTTVHNKEEADGVTGQILTCGALIRSKKIYSDKSNGIQHVCQTLVTASKHRTYHSTLAYTFIVEILEHLTEHQFTEIIWPILSSEVIRPWEKQTIHTVHFLIVAVTKFPSIFTFKYLKSCFGGVNLLNPSSGNQLYKLFWENTSPSAITHPSYECFANYITTSKYLEKFWLTEVDSALRAPTKLREIETLKIFADMLSVADPQQFHVSKYLTENFIAMMCESLKRVKFKKEDALKAFYDALFEALVNWTGKLDNDDGDMEKVEIICKLVHHPSSVTLEKYTTHRVIHQIVANLGEKGVQEIFDVYKNIFLAKIEKCDSSSSESSWSQAERQCAGYMLQHLMGHKSVHSAIEWRQLQLKFFMICSLFHTNDGENIINKKDDNGNITADLVTQMRNVFYSCLQSKLPRLEDEKNILLSLVEICNGILTKKNSNKYLRNAVDEKILKAWNEMYEVIKEQKSDNKLKLVFHILLLHMGLQLFHEPEMAENAIWDLEKCIQKANAQKKSKKTSKKSRSNDESDELEWIEVVIDLFLHLLSHNTSTLRNVVNAVLPHLCDSLSLTAVHQILAVLDMQDGRNPLSKTNENDDQEMDEDEAKDDEQEESDDEDSDNENNEDDDEDEELVEEEEEDNTYTDVLRNAVSSVLIGGTPDDLSSVDLNDMDEEEGKRLDEALGSIFKSMVKPKQYKKTKDYRVETTTTMHFRIRVLDLIEIYTQHKPNLLIIIEIMITLYNMIEFCTDSELQPLANKVEKVLSKLTALRHFATVSDITEKNISDYLRLVIEKKVTAPAFDVHNRMKAKCCVFLIACTKILREKDSGEQQTCSSDVLNMLEEYLDDFVKSRNPTITATLLNDVFKMRWSGIWQLAIHLTESGLTFSTRTYRRIQIIELIDILYKNHELIRQHQKSAKKALKLIERQLQTLIGSLSTQDNVSLREFNLILNVLFAAHRCHTKIGIVSNFDATTLCEHIQTIRKKIRLDNSHCYARFCNINKMKIIHNDAIVSQKSQSSKLTNGQITIQQNGKHSLDSDESASEDDATKPTQRKQKKSKDKAQNSEVPIVNGGKKRKMLNQKVDTRKAKRLRKEERMRAMSKGMNFDDDTASSNKNSQNSHLLKKKVVVRSNL